MGGCCGKHNFVRQSDEVEIEMVRQPRQHDHRPRPRERTSPSQTPEDPFATSSQRDLALLTPRGQWITAFSRSGSAASQSGDSSSAIHTPGCRCRQCHPALYDSLDLGNLRVRTRERAISPQNIRQHRPVIVDELARRVRKR